MSTIIITIAIATALAGGVGTSVYLISTNGGTSETVTATLSGTANQVIVTPNVAAATVVLSTPQDIGTTSTPIFAGLNLTSTLFTENVIPSTVSNNLGSADKPFASIYGQVATATQSGITSLPNLASLGGITFQGGGKVRMSSNYTILYSAATDPDAVDTGGIYYNSASKGVKMNVPVQSTGGNAWVHTSPSPVAFVTVSNVAGVCLAGTCNGNVPWSNYYPSGSGYTLWANGGKASFIIHGSPEYTVSFSAGSLNIVFTGIPSQYLPIGQFKGQASMLLNSVVTLVVYSILPSSGNLVMVVTPITSGGGASLFQVNDVLSFFSNYYQPVEWWYLYT